MDTGKYLQESSGVEGTSRRASRGTESRDETPGVVEWRVGTGTRGHTEDWVPK